MAVAYQLGGHATRHRRDALAWLNAFWPAHYDVHALGAPDLEVATGWVHGYPVMIAMGRLTRHYADVLVSAWIPGVSGGAHSTSLNGAARVHNDVLASLGLTVNAVEGGLHIGAYGVVAAAIVEGGMHSLTATAASHGARLAACLGSIPGEPIGGA
jgi:hypothetical protein